MAGKAEQYKGDLFLEFGRRGVRIEVKTRGKLPAYITDPAINKISGLCYLLSLEEFIELLKANILPEVNTEINDSRCKGLISWFNQDDSDIVAMKQTSHKTWYFAVKIDTAKRIGGRF